MCSPTGSNNRRVLLATSAASGVLALTFGIVVTTGHATIWWIYALTFALGLVLAVERPTMQAILFQLVGRDLLPNAVAANGTINSVSRLIGPAIAGGLIATVGVTVGFYINAASYLVVIAALLALRSSELDRPADDRPDQGQAARGVRLRAQPPGGRQAADRHVDRRCDRAQLPDDVPVDGPLRLRPWAPARSVRR